MVGALVELRVADEHDHARVDALRTQAERRADGERQPVPQRAGRDLDAGHEVAVGVVAERRVERRPRLQPRLGEEAAVAQHGVVRHRAVPLRQQEAVAPRVVDPLRRDVEHALVEHPDHVEGRVARRVVLLVAGHQVMSRGDVVHAPIPQVEVNLKSRHPWLHDRAHDRRAVRAIRASPPARSATTRTSAWSRHGVRRATSAATSAPMLRRLAFIRTAQRVGLSPRGDRGRARHPAEQPHPDQGRLDAAQPRLAASARRADPSARAAPRHARLLHRLRMPQPAALRAEQPRRRGRRPRARAGVPRGPLSRRHGTSLASWRCTSWPAGPTRRSCASPGRAPLDEWSEDYVVPLPRGLSRHIVRIVRLGDRT